MTVFKAYLKVLNKYKLVVIINTVILLVFGLFSLSSSDSVSSFVSTKPDILIVNNDELVGLTQSLVSYLDVNANIIDISSNEEAIDDALFYRDVNYVVYIPKSFHDDFMAGKNPKINVKSTGDYQASLAQLMVERFMKTAQIYQKNNFSENELIDALNDTIKTNTNVSITSTINTVELSESSTYYNFASYSLMAGTIQIIGLMLSVFKNKSIAQRTIVSSTDYKKSNRSLLLSNSLFSLILWLFYVIIGYFLVGNVYFSIQGVIYLINSLIFTICVTALAFLIGTLISDKNAISGITNCVALGSAFLCGAFVPQEFLPVAVINIAHFLPTYWYIKTNNLLTEIEVFNLSNLKPILINIFVIIIFTILFIIIINIVNNRKQKRV